MNTLLDSEQAAKVNGIIAMAEAAKAEAEYNATMEKVAKANKVTRAVKAAEKAAAEAKEAKEKEKAAKEKEKAAKAEVKAKEKAEKAKEKAKEKAAKEAAAKVKAEKEKAEKEAAEEAAAYASAYHAAMAVETVVEFKTEAEAIAAAREVIKTAKGNITPALHLIFYWACWRGIRKTEEEKALHARQAVCEKLGITTKAGKGGDSYGSLRLILDRAIALFKAQGTIMAKYFDDADTIPEFTVKMEPFIKAMKEAEKAAKEAEAKAEAEKAEAEAKELAFLREQYRRMNEAK